MSNLLTTIQSIAVNAVKSTNPVEYCIGTVTSSDPLRVRLNDNTLEIWGDTLMLTSSVVERKLTIKKHTHDIGETLATHTHPFTGEFKGTITPPEPPATMAGVVSGSVSASSELTTTTTVVDTILDAFVTEHGVEQLDAEKDNDKIVVTINRALRKDDKVIMMRVYGGQKFIILSRIFKRDDETE